MSAAPPSPNSNNQRFPRPLIRLESPSATRRARAGPNMSSSASLCKVIRSRGALSKEIYSSVVLNQSPFSPRMIFLQEVSQLLRQSEFICPRQRHKTLTHISSSFSIPFDTSLSRRNRVYPPLPPPPSSSSKVSVLHPAAGSACPGRSAPGPFPAAPPHRKVPLRPRPAPQM